MAHDLDQQPRRIATRTGSDFQRVLRCLHTGLHANDVVDAVGDALIDRDDEVVGGHVLVGQGGQVLLQQRTSRLDGEVGRKIGLLLLLILEGYGLRVVGKKIVKRVKHRHLGDEIDLDLEFAGLLREHDTRQPVRLRILLPVDEMRLGRDPLRVGENAGTTVWRGTQPDDLRPKLDRLVVVVLGDVV